MSDFRKQCYDLVSKVPKGKVTTYSEIARALGGKGYRAVGTAMAKNEQLITIPCHRVVKSDGAIGQYAKGTKKKVALLKKEGVPVEGEKVKDLAAVLYRFY